MSARKRNRTLATAFRKGQQALQTGKENPYARKIYQDAFKRGKGEKVNA